MKTFCVLGVTLVALILVALGLGLTWGAFGAIFYILWNAASSTFHTQPVTLAQCLRVTESIAAVIFTVYAAIAIVGNSLKLIFA